VRAEAEEEARAPFAHGALPPWAPANPSPPAAGALFGVTLFNLATPLLAFTGARGAGSGVGAVVGGVERRAVGGSFSLGWGGAWTPPLPAHAPASALAAALTALPPLVASAAWGGGVAVARRGGDAGGGRSYLVAVFGAAPMGEEGGSLGVRDEGLEGGGGGAARAHLVPLERPRAAAAAPGRDARFSLLPTGAPTTAFTVLGDAAFPPAHADSARVLRVGAPSPLHSGAEALPLLAAAPPGAALTLAGPLTAVISAWRSVALTPGAGWSGAAAVCLRLRSEAAGAPAFPPLGATLPLRVATVNTPPALSLLDPAAPPGGPPGLSAPLHSTLEGAPLPLGAAAALAVVDGDTGGGRGRVEVRLSAGVGCFALGGDGAGACRGGAGARAPAAAPPSPAAPPLAFAGTVAAVNDALAHVVYYPPPHWAGSDVVMVSVGDVGGVGRASERAAARGAGEADGDLPPAGALGGSTAILTLAGGSDLTLGWAGEPPASLPGGVYRGGNATDAARPGYTVQRLIRVGVLPVNDRPVVTVCAACGGVQALKAGIETVVGDGGVALYDADFVDWTGGGEASEGVRVVAVGVGCLAPRKYNPLTPPPPPTHTRTRAPLTRDSPGHGRVPHGASAGAGQRANPGPLGPPCSLGRRGPRRGALLHVSRERPGGGAGAHALGALPRPVGFPAHPKHRPGRRQPPRARCGRL
jgi:hypothetical protein